MKLQKYIITAVIVALGLCFIFSFEPTVFAESFGTGNATPLTKKPLGDEYFIFMLALAIAIVYEIVRIVILIVKINKLKKSKTTLAIVPYSIATLLPAAGFKAILIIEVVLFAALYVTKRVLANKLKKLS